MARAPIAYLFSIKEIDSMPAEEMIWLTSNGH